MTIKIVQQVKMRRSLHEIHFNLAAVKTQVIEKTSLYGMSISESQMGSLMVTL